MKILYNHKYYSCKSLADELNINYNFFRRGIKENLSVDEIISQYNDKKCIIEYKGKKYRSKKMLAEELEIPRYLFLGKDSLNDDAIDEIIENHKKMKLT